MTNTSPVPPPPGQPTPTPHSKPHGPGIVVRSFGVVGNVIWVVFAGFWIACAYLIAAVANAITIIGIPFALQALKLAGYALWPFGKTVATRPGGPGAVSTLGNILWFLLGGAGIALMHFLLGIILCATIIGIPFGIPNFKLARLALWPMGRVVLPVEFAD